MDRRSGGKAAYAGQSRPARSSYHFDDRDRGHLLWHGAGQGPETPDHGPAPDAEPEHGGSRDRARGGASADFVGDHGPAGATGYFPRFGRRGPNRRAQRFHRGLYRVVRVDGEEWHSSG